METSDVAVYDALSTMTRRMPPRIIPVTGLAQQTTTA